MVVGEEDRFAMAAGEGFCFSTFTVAVDGADGMDDEFGGEASAVGDDGFAGGEVADFCDDGFTFGEDGWAAGAVNGAVHASAAEERGVSGVDDGVGSFFGDVGGTVEGEGFCGSEEDAHGGVREV